MRPLEVALEFRQAALVKFLGWVPEVPTKLRFVTSTSTSVTIRWRQPFSDGIWVDKHELEVVQLPDAYLPHGNSTGAPLPPAVQAEHDVEWEEQRRELEDGMSAVHRADPFYMHAVGAPMFVMGGHHPGHTLEGVGLFTAYRIRLRVHSLAGWSPLSESLEVHSARTTAAGCRNAHAVTLTCVCCWCLPRQRRHRTNPPR